MKSEQINIRISEHDKNNLLIISKSYGFKTISEYIRFICLNVKNIKIQVGKYE